jgi:SAM-dependent methyltransferase
MTTAERGTDSARPTSRFFAGPLRDYVLQCLGRPVGVLQAGCLAPLGELGLGQLTEGGFDISVTVVDTDDPLAESVLRDAGGGYESVLTGDLRTVPVPQRKYDIVYCARLIEHIQHVELVLDRLISALKPGGLLLLRTGDRYSAAAFLDRRLPRGARRAIWSRLHPGVPGPFPAVYEKMVCEQGIASYTTKRGLVIASRGAELTLREHQARISSVVRVTCAAISWLSHGRFSARHDELLYVIRKPQDRFARVV